MRILVVAPIVLAAASLACFAIPSVNRHSVYQIGETQSQSQSQIGDAALQTSEPQLPEMVYPESVPDQSFAGMPEVVFAGDRRPTEPGLPTTEYGDRSGEHVYQIAVATEPAGAIPVTVFAGENATGSGLPETVLSTSANEFPAEEVSEAAPATVLAGEEEQPARENEAAVLAEQMRHAQDLSAANNPNGYAVETEYGHYPPPQIHPSPYTKYTAAQQAGINPCENKKNLPSPYGSLTDAQRRAQTKCQW